MVIYYTLYLRKPGWTVTLMLILALVIMFSLSAFPVAVGLFRPL